jgi:hypothetical protein
VDVTSELGESRYRGEVNHCPFAKMIPPDKLRFGSPLEFTHDQIFVIADSRNPEPE